MPLTRVTEKVGGLPIGSIIAVSFETIPDGFLECNGTALPRTTYSDLFALIGTRYGIGNGSTTFNIPDLRGEFLRGWDHGKGTDPDRLTRTDAGGGITGDQVGTKQLDEFKSHKHDTQVSNDDDGGSSWGGYTPDDSSSSVTNNLGTDTGFAGGLETRPRNINVMYCIKF